ncbi:MAG TPA: hypothetical protein VGC89_01155 [Pyrinomonadaceae bacterium]
MNILGSLNESGQDFPSPAPEPKRLPAIVSIVVACLLLGALIGIGYLVFFRNTEQKSSRQEQRQSDMPAPVSTEAQIFEDEPILKDSKAVIGGTVRNLSRASLENLTLEIELKRRADGSTEARAIPVEPKTIAPGAEGKYSFLIARQEFSGTQIKRLKSSTRSALIVFKTAPGARRPKELPTEPPTRTVIVERPSPRPSGEEFINTPDTPTRVP